MKITFRAIIVGLLLSLASCHSSSPVEWNGECEVPPVMTHSASGAASELLAAALAADHGAGISAAVLVDGELVWRDAVGIAARDAPLSSAARMRIGSVSKPVTAMLALAQVEKGKLNLHAPLKELVFEVPDQAITAYQLGTHTSGFRHYNFSNLLEANNLKHYRDLTASLDTFINDPILFVPGEKFGYSSFGYNLLGVAIERAAGEPYATVLSQTMTERFDISSIMLDDADAPVACRPGFYAAIFGRLLLPTLTRDNSDYYPSGGLVSTAEDLARFAHLTFNAEPGLRFRELLTVPPTITDGTQSGYTFGWQVEYADDGSIKWLGHGGQTNGAYASVRYYPGERVAVAAITNYNLAATSRRAAFFDAVREELPALFLGAEVLPQTKRQ